VGFSSLPNLALATMRYSWRMIFVDILRNFRVGWLIAALLIMPAFAIAARKSVAIPQIQAPPTVAPATLPASFTETIQNGIANGAYRSVAVGLIEGKQHSSFYFGHRGGNSSALIDDSSLFEIGAVTDVFTGVLLAQAAIEGKLRLADSIRNLLPAQFPFTVSHVGDISLEALATQRSNLPSQPANLFPTDLDDPYTDYATEDLFALLAYYRPVADDGEKPASYSILNGGLLGSLLGRAYGTPFTQILTTKILAPLGLRHIGFRDDEALLSGHARGEAAAHWHYGALAGAAGLRATLPDLMQFLQLNLTPADSPLRAALLLARQPRATAGVDQLALGWNVRDVVAGETTWPLIWRASQTAGFASFIGFRTDKQKAIVLLGNATDDLAPLGIAWLTDAVPPSAPHGYTAVATIELGAYPGLYEILPGNDVIVRVAAGALSLQMPGELPLRLHPLDRDVYAADAGTLGATFMRNVDEITGLVLHVNGDHVSARRLSVRAPHIVRTPMQGNTAPGDVVGDYPLDADTWMRIANRNGRLTLQLTMGERYSIFAYAQDRYTDADGAVELEFKRDDEGRIIKAVLDLAGAQRDALPLHRISP
jgi:serine-type D-Ala-D-Ala carboxypeptidase/endopeptidase